MRPYLLVSLQDRAQQLSAKAVLAASCVMLLVDVFISKVPYLLVTLQCRPQQLAAKVGLVDSNQHGGCPHIDLCCLRLICNKVYTAA
jgi:hypothetical protein